MRAQPSYIRTIKPNEHRSATEYDTKAIIHQIKYLGLQENIRVRRAGFAYRNTFEKMVERCPEISMSVWHELTGDFGQVLPSLEEHIIRRRVHLARRSEDSMRANP